MIQKLCAACTAIASTLVVTPATAADLSTRIVVSPIVQPFYLVNQGPVISGPGIMIVAIGYTNTGLHQPYPFIGRSADYSAWRPVAVRKVWRRKPLRVRY